MEREADFETRQYDSQAHALETELNNVQVEYDGQLATLCGTVHDDATGEDVPDVLFAMLPAQRPYVDETGTREERYGQYLPGETPSGSIYEQWLAIYAAETQVQGAVQDLRGLYDEMVIIQDTANSMAEGHENLARLSLTTGEELAALETQRADIQEYAIRATANEEQAKLIRGTEIGLVDDWVSLHEDLFSGNVAGALNTILDGGQSIGQTWNQCVALQNIANINADAQRQLSDVDAQEDRIRAYQDASVHFQEAQDIRGKAAEQLQIMLVQAERLKLNILLAEQQAQMARARLATLCKQVGYLLQERARSLYLAAHNPITRPDYRLARDLAVRDADESFSYAQERCYLAAKSLEYRLSEPPGGPHQAVVGTAIKNLFAARRVEQLGGMTGVLKLLEGLKDAADGEAGTRGVYHLIVSIRNYVKQNNSTLFDPGSPVIRHDYYSDGNWQNSDRRWFEFLKSCLVTRNEELMFELSFSTSLYDESANNTGPTALPSLARRLNPLYDPGLRNFLISYEGERIGDRYGVMVNIPTSRAWSIPGPMMAELRQEGASAIAFSAPATLAATRIWNLEPVKDSIYVKINNDLPPGLPEGTHPSAPRFHERSPANDRWVLSISPSSGVAPGNSQFIHYIDAMTLEDFTNLSLTASNCKVEDIEIQFSVTAISAKRGR